MGPHSSGWFRDETLMLVRGALCRQVRLSRGGLQILEAKTRKLEQLLRLKDEKVDALEARLRAGHLA